MRFPEQLRNSRRRNAVRSSGNGGLVDVNNDNPFANFSKVTYRPVAGNATYVECKPELAAAADNKAYLVTTDMEVAYISGDGRRTTYDRFVGRQPQHATFRPVDAQLIAVGDSVGALRIFRTPSSATANLELQAGDLAPSANNHQVPLRTINKAHSQAVRAVSWANKHIVFTGSDDKHIALWDITTSSLLFKTLAHADAVRTNAVCEELGMAASGGYDHRVKIWNIASYLRPTKSHTATHAEDSAMDVEADSADATATAIEAQYVECLLDLDHGAPVECVKFAVTTPQLRSSLTSETTKVVYSCGGTTLRAWDLQRGGYLLRSVTDAFAKTITSIDISRSGRHVYAASLDGIIKIFDSTSFACLHVHSVTSSIQTPISAPQTPLAAISAASSSAAGASAKTTLLPVLSVAISPDDDRIVTATVDSTAVAEAPELELEASDDAEAPPQPKQKIRKRRTVVEIDRKAPVRMVKAELEQQRLTIDNYRHLVNSYLIDQVLRMKQKIERPEKRQLTLQPFQKLLAQFKFSTALDVALFHYMEKPVIVMSLIEEMHAESGLLKALANRDEVSLLPVVHFVYRWIRDPRFTARIVKLLAEPVLDIYGAVVGHSQRIDMYLRAIQTQVTAELQLQQQMLSLRGMLDSLLVFASTTNTTEP